MDERQQEQIRDRLLDERQEQAEARPDAEQGEEMAE